MENFGEQLKNRRKESGISQSELAERLGVHIQTVSKWERGIMLPDVGQFGDIAKALDLPLETLLMQPLGEKSYTGEFSVSALSEKIIELRRKKGLSQSDVAEAVDCSPDAVSRWERGVTCPYIDNIIALADVFGVPLSALYFSDLHKKSADKKVPDKSGGSRTPSKRLKIALGAGFAAAITALCVVLAIILPGTLRTKADYNNYSEIVVDGEIVRVVTGTRYMPKKEVRSGYDFIGWQDKSGEFVSVPVTVGEEVMVINPVYRLIEYPITYELDGGEFVSEPVRSCNVESGIITLPVPKRDGCVFLGWKYEGNTDNYVTSISCARSEIVLYARWERKTDFCEIIVDGVGHWATKGSQFTPEHEEKEGYDFVGWKDKSGNVVSVPITVDKDVEITAEYQIHEYAIEYQLNGGKFLIEPPRTYTIKRGALISPVREGNNFSGWYDNPEFSGSKIDYIRGRTGDIVLYAKWDEVETGINEDGFVYAIEDSRAVITDYIGDRGKDVWLNIPEKIKTFPVTKIRCTFGSGVIDEYCEYAGITMPLLEELGENAFAWVKCESEVEIPPTVNVIGRNCFYAAKLNLKFSTAGYSLETVGEYAFANAKLTSPLILPESVRRIKKGGLYNVCAVLNDGLEIIDEGAIYLEDGNEEIFVPSSVKYIGKNGIDCRRTDKGKIYMQGDVSSIAGFPYGWRSGIEVEYSHKSFKLTLRVGGSTKTVFGYRVVLPAQEYSFGRCFVGWKTLNGEIFSGKVYHGNYGDTLTACYEQIEEKEGRRADYALFVEEGDTRVLFVPAAGMDAFYFKPNLSGNVTISVSCPDDPDLSFVFIYRGEYFSSGSLFDVTPDSVIKLECYGLVNARYCTITIKKLW